MVSHNSPHWGQHHLVSPSMTLTEGPSARSASWQMTPSCDTVDLLDGVHPIQGDLDRLERWAKANPMKLYKGKCKVLHPNWSNRQNQHRSGTTMSTLTKEEKCILKKQTIQNLLKIVSRIYYHLATMKNHKLIPLHWNIPPEQ